MINYYGRDIKLDEWKNTNILWVTKNLLPYAVPHVVTNSLKCFESENTEFNRLRLAIKFVEENIEGHSDILGLSFVYSEVQALFFRSFFLASAGFYKESIFDLRSALELSLFYSSEFSDNESVTDLEDFYNHLIDQRKKISLWLNSERQTPNKREFFKNFRKRESIANLLDNTKFKEDLDKLSAQLNSFVHTQGSKFTNLSMHGGEAGLTLPPNFNHHLAEIFQNLFIDTVELVGILMVATKPQLLDEEFAARIFESFAEVPDGLWGRSAKNFFNLVRSSYHEYFSPLWIRLPDL